MNEQKIKEVFSDKAFVESLIAMETPEEVQKALAAKDVDLSVEEIKKIGELAQKKAEGNLSEEELANVAGGFLVTGTTIVGLGTLLASLWGISAGAGYVQRKTEGRW